MCATCRLRYTWTTAALLNNGSIGCMSARTGGMIAGAIAETVATTGPIAGILARIVDTIAAARDVTIAAAVGADPLDASGAVRRIPVGEDRDG
jgi:hypothetical protein